MALKDWKKVGMREWKHKKHLIEIIIPEMKMEKGRKIYNAMIISEKGWVSEQIDSQSGWVTKEKAIKFAKSYMRTH